MILTTNVALFPKTLLVFYIALCVSLLFLVIYKLVINKKIDYITIGVFVISIVIGLLNNYNDIKNIVTIYMIVAYLYAAFFTLLFLYKTYISSIRHKKIIEHVKNDSSDFYLCLNKKHKLVDFSGNLSNYTRLSKKELLGLDGWKVILNNLDVLRINEAELIESNEKTFLDHIEDDITKNKMTSFNMDVSLPNENKIVHFVGYVQGHYLLNHLIGTAIYVYRDRLSEVQLIVDKLNKSNNALINYKNVQKILMSLSDGVCLYFDYDEKIYYATQSFMDYCGLNKATYTFQEVFAMIDERDKESYIEQSELINSTNATRIKFRFNVKNKCYIAIEDSIFITKEGQEFVSMIRLIGLDNEKTYNEILTTKESTDLLDTLSTIVLSHKVQETKDIIEHALRIGENEE